MDFASRSESVVLLAGITHDGVICVLREHCRKAALVADHLDALDRWRAERLFRRATELGDSPATPPLDFIGIDPAGNARNDQTGDTNTQLLATRAYPAKFRASRIGEGIRLVRARLAPAWSPARVPPCSAWGPSSSSSSSSPATVPRLLIHSSCTRLIECLTRYRYDENKPESLEPLKDGTDHACDALRYMILNLDSPHRMEVRAWA
jgi:hypothetical protein